MKQAVSSDFKLGILGGGQLGKMLCHVTNRLDIATYILDPTKNCPASNVCNNHTIGSFKDFDTVYSFGKDKDIVTVEIEAVNTEALKKLEKEGVKVHPSSEVLELIQDKGIQKEFYQKNGFPTSKFELFSSADDIRNAVNNGKLMLPFVQKARKDGYDGKGVKVVRVKEDLKELLETPSVVEETVDIAKEIAVIAARNETGQIKCFPAVEMEFNPNSNLVELLACPAKITPEQEEIAEELSKGIIEKLKVVGLLAIEFFIDREGNVIVNEAAPRPHNSGHHTIESHYISQYEQHIRAILGFPLGENGIIAPSVMINILGEKGYSGPVKYEGLNECLEIKGVNIHLYGKKETRPSRKMGHATILAKSLDAAKTKAKRVQETLKVKSWE